VIENIYRELKIGDSGYVEKTITEADVYMYAGVTGDFSWLHVNEWRAKKGHFRTRIVHGMLLVGLISTVIGNELPGAGTIYEYQEVKFLKPCYINDTVRAETEVIELMPAGRIKLRTTCYNQHNDTIVEGTAIVIPPRQHIVSSKFKEKDNSIVGEF
jgi:3-hydroxybutyryl-CoA dehydratase